MNREHYARVRRHLLEARSRRGADREAYLEGLDPALRDEVVSLLRSDPGDGGLVATGGVAQNVDDAFLERLDAARASHPESIGPYRVLEVLGEGGMGVVYRAQQEAPLRREVAIKVIRRGMDTRRVVARFDAERQTLAALAHPNIAQVHDAGEDEVGSPYFVMEMVTGQTLTDYCDDERLTTDQRLDLFLEVCHAVQHAHQRGIIHRDLKPSNVLVSTASGSPTVKVIDFGIAKAVEEDPAQSMMTQSGQLVGTPDYMSPEQAGMIPGGVDTRSDIYSLGVMLYKLLSGQLPHRFESATPLEMQRVLEQDPAKPSTVVTRGGSSEEVERTRRSSVRRLTRELAGDLDNIVMMALRKEPARRYPSVDALAEDIQRYRRGLPVRARQDTLRYRLSKFVRRNAWGVTAAAVGILALAGFTVSTLVQSARVARERDRANVEAETARRVAEFMEEIFDVSDPSEARGNTVTAREVLDRGAERIATELQDEPLVRASLMDAIGRVYSRLGLFGPADSLLAEAIRTRVAVLGEDHLDVADSQTNRGHLLMDLGRFEEARTLFERALATQQAQLNDEHQKISDSLYNLGSIFLEMGDLDTAEARFRDLVASDTRLYGAVHENTALSHNDLGSVLLAKGEYDAAEAEYRRALSIYREVWGDDHPEVATTMANLGNLLRRKGDLDAAVEMSSRALELRRKILGPDHLHVGISLNNLGNQVREQGDLVRAERLIREGLGVKRRAQEGPSPSLAVSLVTLGRLLLDDGRFDEAEAAYVEARDVIEATLPADHPRAAAPWKGIGMARLQRGDARAAEEPLRRALSVQRAHLSPHSSGVLTTLLALGRSALEQGKREDAESRFLEVHRAATTADDRSLRAQAARHLVELYEAWGREADAARFRSDATGTGR